jgi:hypothetical protein
MYEYSIDLSNFAACFSTNNSSLSRGAKHTVIVTATKVSKLVHENVRVDPWPIATVVSIVFASLFIATILVLKIIYSSADEFRSNDNQYDLVLFKAPLSSVQKHVGLSGQTKMFENDEVRMHNLKAVAESGFDVATLEVSRLTAAYSKKSSAVNSSQA